jgi:hypothetical protein
VRQYLLRAAAQTAVKAGTKMAASAQQKIAKASVRVNRNVPAVTSPSFAMTFWRRRINRNASTDASVR